MQRLIENLPGWQKNHFFWGAQPHEILKQHFLRLVRNLSFFLCSIISPQAIADEMEKGNEVIDFQVYISTLTLKEKGDFF